MTDNELRGVILRKFYELRRDRGIYRLEADELGLISNEDYNRIGQQLGEKNLIEWHAPLSGDGCGRITGYGVDVIEGVTPSPRGITIYDHSVSVHSSNNVQIGNNNSIKVDTSIEIQKIMSAIEKADLSDDKKAEAKNLLERLATNPAFASIVGALIGLGGGSAAG